MRSLFRSFAGGEVNVELLSHVGDVRLETGLSLCSNGFTLPHGPARKRPGTPHIAVTRDSGNGTARILPFVFSLTQTYVIEFGATAAPNTGYFRFFQNGIATMVTDGGVPPSYVRNKTFVNTDISAAANTVTFGSALDFTTGMPVYVTNDAGGASPPTLPLLTITPNTIVYVRVVGLVVTFHPTQADAVGNTNIIDLTAPPAANYRLNYAYAVGDLVEGTIAGAPGYHYCRLNPTANGAAQITPGNAAYWYLEPSSGVYEIPHPYLQSNLPFVRYWQSNDVMSLVHNDHPPRELRRFGVALWKLVDTSFVPVLAAPTNLVGTATEAGMSVTIATGAGGVVNANPLRVHTTSKLPWINGESVVGVINFVSGRVPAIGIGHFRAADINGNDCDIVNNDGTGINATGFGNVTSNDLRSVPFSADSTNKYKVTAVDGDGNESLASNEVTVTNNLFAEGAYNTLTWNAVVGASRYRVYRQTNSAYGLIGTTEAGVLTLMDDQLDADLSFSLPFVDNTITVPPYPEAGCYHEQRKVFGRDQRIWMTRPGTEADLTYTIPVKDDDRVSVGMAATEFSRIAHLVSMGSLIALTNSTEFAILSPDSEVITPSAVMPKAQTFIGSSHVRPVIVNNSLLFAASRGGHLRELDYQVQAQGFVTGDLSLRATHLFDTLTIVDMAFSKAPYPILWVVSSNGKLLGLTYVPDQEVAGWHQHTLGGNAIVESCCVVPEGNEDRLYLVVQRTINSAVVRHIVRMAPMIAPTINDSVFVDSGLTFTNVPSGVLGGFTHLIGQTVSILADGIVLPNQVVNGSGQIMLPTVKTLYAKVTAGLPFEMLLTTIPLSMQTDGFGHGRRKNVGRVWARIVNSAPFFLGPNVSELAPSDAAAPSVQGLLVAETLRTDSVPARAPGKWTDDGQLTLRSSVPLPLFVSGLTLEEAIGD